MVYVCTSMAEGGFIFECESLSNAILYTEAFDSLTIVQFRSQTSHSWDMVHCECETEINDFFTFWPN